MNSAKWNLENLRSLGHWVATPPTQAQNLIVFMGHTVLEIRSSSRDKEISEGPRFLLQEFLCEFLESYLVLPVTRVD